jgi:hypothetical protein
MSAGQKIAMLIFLFVTWVGIEFVTTKGFIYPILRQLPIISSLRANMRFAGIFIFPLAFLGAVFFNLHARKWTETKKLKTFIYINILALLPLIFYFTFKEDLYWQFYNIAEANQIYNEMQEGKSFEITSVGIVDGKNTGALLYRTSNLNVYEPIFGFKLEHFHPQIKPGSVWLESNGHYNLTNPMGYLYPGRGGYETFEPFRTEDRALMEDFINHRQPTWDIPAHQIIINHVSTITALLTLIFLSTQLIPKK